MILNRRIFLLQVRTILLINTEAVIRSDETFFELIYVCSSTRDCTRDYAEQLFENDLNRQWFFSNERYAKLREELQELLAPSFLTNAAKQLECFSLHHSLNKCTKTVKVCHSQVANDKLTDGHCCAEKKVSANLTMLGKSKSENFIWDKESTQLSYSCNYTKCNSNNLTNNLRSIVQQQYKDLYLTSADFLTVTSPTKGRPIISTTHKAATLTRSRQQEQEIEQLLHGTSSHYLLSMNNDATLKAGAMTLNGNRFFQFIALITAITVSNLRLYLV
jgi:hypothetical protein